MMTLNAAKGVRDAIVEGTAMLGLPLSPALLAMMKCGDPGRCKQHRCPVCATFLTERLCRLHLSDAVRGQRWRGGGCALRSYTYAAEETKPIDIKGISAALEATMKRWESNFHRQEGSEGKSFGCLATFGLVEDAGSNDRREKVMVVEYAVTSADPLGDYDMDETLRDCFNDNVANVPTFGDDQFSIMPDQGLLFGYTKRRLDQLARPLPVTDRKRLARIAANYGDHRLDARLLTRGLSTEGDELIFDANFDFLWLTY